MNEQLLREITNISGGIFLFLPARTESQISNSFLSHNLLQLLSTFFSNLFEIFLNMQDKKKYSKARFDRPSIKLLFDVFDCVAVSTYDECEILICFSLATAAKSFCFLYQTLHIAQMHREHRSTTSNWIKII